VRRIGVDIAVENLWHLGTIRGSSPALRTALGRTPTVGDGRRGGPPVLASASPALSTIHTTYYCYSREISPNQDMDREGDL
jgi:hypothetical protein